MKHKASTVSAAKNHEGESSDLTCCCLSADDRRGIGIKWVGANGQGK
jgi:hypothetical protein